MNAFDSINDNTDETRRGILKGSGAAIAAAFAGPIAGLATRSADAAVLSGAECVAAAASARVASPYGACVPTNDLTTGLPLIQLPPGFSYKSYGWVNDVMNDGVPTPSAHDGLGIALSRRVGRSTELILVRNHERSGGATFGTASTPKYDNLNGGGTTNLVWRDGNFVESYSTLSGTIRNCAGGSSNWGSYLSNEETLSNNLSGGKLHGYIFEVPATRPASAIPLVAMGRMNHEASALDLETGYWYLTEDQSSANTLYRFRPTNDVGSIGSLEDGGVLEGLAVVGSINRDLRTPTLCQEFSCEWVAIANPDLNAGTVPNGTGTSTASGPYRQAYANGAARFGANEGCWVANGIVYFTDKAVGTVNGVARRGRIWALDLDTMTLKAIFVANSSVTPTPAGDVGNSPDNICVSPRGGVLFCEDGGGTADLESGGVVADRLMGLKADGSGYIFARNNYNFTAAQLAAVGKPNATSGNRRNSEWAGAVFSPDGRVLFANLQGAGLTVAITGPWLKGTL